MQRTEPCVGRASPRLGEALLPPEDERPLPPHLLQPLLPCSAAQMPQCAMRRSLSTFKPALRGMNPALRLPLNVCASVRCSAHECPRHAPSADGHHEPLHLIETASDHRTVPCPCFHR